MGAAAGKKEIKVELKLYPMKEMSGKAREFVGADPELKKTVEKPVTWSDKGEFDPRKHTKKSLDEDILNAARMPFKIFANRVDAAAKDGKGDKDKIRKTILKDFDEAVKGAIANASLAFEEIESGKGDNKKALKDGKAAFAKLDGIDFHDSFAGPFYLVGDALDDIKVALKAKGGDSARAFDKARKSFDTASTVYDKAGKEAFAAVDFLLKTGRSLKNSKDADPALSAFGQQIMKSESIFDEFVKAAEAFGKVVEDCVAFFKSNSAEVKDVEQRIKDLTAANAVFKTASEVEDLAKKLKPAFLKIEKDLK